jgi:hypothetical protein
MNFTIRKDEQLSPHLAMTTVTGGDRALAKISFIFYGQEYWIVITPVELGFDRVKLPVDGFGDDGFALQFVLERQHWPQIKQAFLDYQYQVDTQLKIYGDKN